MMSLEAAGAVGLSPIQPVERIASVGGAPLPAESRTPVESPADAARRTSELEDAARAINAELEPYSVALEFSRDDETGATVVRVLDQRTGDVLRQIPQEALLRLSAALGELQGKIFDRQA